MNSVLDLFRKRAVTLELRDNDVTIHCRTREAAESLTKWLETLADNAALDATGIQNIDAVADDFVNGKSISQVMNERGLNRVQAEFAVRWCLKKLVDRISMLPEADVTETPATTRNWTFEELCLGDMFLTEHARWVKMSPTEAMVVMSNKLRLGSTGELNPRLEVRLLYSTVLTPRKTIE